MVKCIKFPDFIIEFHEDKGEILIITYFGTLIIKLNDLKIIDVKSTNPYLKLEKCIE
ncbi:MAG: hypothetical protein QXT03_05675 [Desulfurococcaceae archaeon]